MKYIILLLESDYKYHLCNNDITNYDYTTMHNWCYSRKPLKFNLIESVAQYKKIRKIYPKNKFHIKIYEET